MEATTEKPTRKPTLHWGHPDGHIPKFELPEEASPPVSPAQLAVAFLGALGVAVAGWRLGVAGQAAAPVDVGAVWLLPFVLLLVCIAAMPFLARHFWERYYGWVAAGLGVVVAGYYLLVRHAGANVAHLLGDYVSFLFLMGSLFTVSGGILIHVRRRATPAANTALLLAGALLANVFGTTGAAMLLIRPYLRMNHGHARPYHVVFFIFCVANCGGGLTPIGDPPLFLGYLRGVPFWWVLHECWPLWAVAMAVLLATFYVWDARGQRRMPRPAAPADRLQPGLSIYGISNLGFICLILAAAFMDAPWRELLMAVGAFGSLAVTPHRIHVENHFNFAPIREVAFLFLGIFATMAPAMDYLYVHAQRPGFGRLLETPGRYYAASGSLSAVLDSGPAYLAFLEAQRGRLDQVAIHDLLSSTMFLPATDRERQLVAHTQLALQRFNPDRVAAGTVRREDVEMAMLLGDASLKWFLVALSMGTVMFGACTYIGNGPNFMVRTIAEHGGVKCPSFMGYVVCYALPVMGGVLFLLWLIFLRGR